MTQSFGPLAGSSLGVVLLHGPALLLAQDAAMPVWIPGVGGFAVLAVAGRWSGVAAVMCRPALMNLVGARGGVSAVVAAAEHLIVAQCST